MSYGKKLALEVMRTAPEGVRSVVIDSVAPPNARFYDTNILPVQEGVQAVVDQCAADPACAAAFPDLGATINRVAEKLQANPIPAARGRPTVTLQTMIALFEDRNGATALRNATAWIPLILTEWDRGETAAWDLFSSGVTMRPTATADLLKPHATRLTPEQAALAALLLDTAAAARTGDRAVAAAIQALADSLARSAQGTGALAKRFDEAVTRAIIRTGARDRMLRFVAAYAGLAARSPDREVLRTLVTEHLPPGDIAPTLALLDQLTEADVAGVFAAVSAEARHAWKPIVDLMDLMVVACQEDMPFNSLEGMKAVVSGLRYPFLAASTYVDTTPYDVCAFLPPALPRPDFHEAVTSDLPTLVLYGLNDTQTSAEDARLAASSLPNARILGFPEAGHGALIFSQCARDIGTAFVERPTEPLDSSCIAGLKPHWVLPAK